MTNPAHVHQAIISADAPPRPACDGSGPSVARAADVTCPACLALAAGRKARTELHDSHAIPSQDEPKPADVIVLPVDDPVLIDKDGDRWKVVASNADSDVTMTIARVIRDYGPVTVAGVEQPAKTHDLSVRKGDGDNLVITVENEKDDVRVYMPTGFAQDLGVVLDLLTPAQVRLLIGELTGGER
jgi:hypothetical protein